MLFFRAELEREAGGRIFNAAEGTETRNQVCKQFFRILRSLVVHLLGRWKILATKDLPSPPARLAQVDLLATRQVLLSNRAQALEQRARLQLWTRTTWWRRRVASGFGLRRARNGSGRLRLEPTRFLVCSASLLFTFPQYFRGKIFLTGSIYLFFRLMQLLKTLAHQTLVGQCCQTERGPARRPPGRPTLKPARGAGNLEVLALGSFFLEEESTATREATTLGGSPNQMGPW